MAGLSRLLTVATLPLMVLLIFWASGIEGESGDLAPPPGGALVLADLRGHAIHVWTLPEDGVRTLPLPGAPHELVLLGGKVYATLAREDTLVAVYPSGPALVEAALLAGYPHGIVTDGTDLFVALGERDRVVRIRPGSLAPAAEWATGARPHALAILDGTVWVAEAGDGTLRAIGSGQPVRVGGVSESVVPLAGGRLAVADAAGAVAVVDARTQEVRRFATGGRPVRVLGLGDSRVAVADAGLMRLVVLDVDEGTITARSVGALPDGLCSSPDGEYLAVTSAGEGKVSVFSTRTWQLVLERPIGSGLGSCLWLPR